MAGTGEQATKGRPPDSAFDNDLLDDGSSNASFAPLTAGLLARKGDAQPAHEPYSKARVDEGAREMPPGVRHKIDEPKRARTGAAPSGGIGPVMVEAEGEYTNNPFQFAASQDLKDIIEREPPLEPDPVHAARAADLKLVGPDAPCVEDAPAVGAFNLQPLGSIPALVREAGSEVAPEIAGPPAAGADPGAEIATERLQPAIDRASIYPAPAMEALVFPQEQRQEPAAAAEPGAPDSSAADKMAPPAANAETAQPNPRPPCAERRSTPPSRKRRAAVTFRMSTHDFLRMKLASAELETSCQELLLSALEEYLDALGIERFDQCACLARAADACEAAAVKSA